MPDAILVGVSYGSNDWGGGNQRGRDFTAPAEDREHYGGAESFSAFFREVLFPLIEERYPSDPARRIVFGQSLGGQYVLFAAQTQADLFWGHIASNAALHRNLEFFLDFEFDDTKTNAKLFASSGSNDDPRFREPALEWFSHWEAAENKPWALRTETLEGENHFSAPPTAFRAGLLWLFSEDGAAD